MKRNFQGISKTLKSPLDHIVDLFGFIFYHSFFLYSLTM